MHSSYNIPSNHYYFALSFNSIFCQILQVRTPVFNLFHSESYLAKYYLTQFIYLDRCSIYKQLHKFELALLKPTLHTTFTICQLYIQNVVKLPLKYVTHILNNENPNWLPLKNMLPIYLIMEINLLPLKICHTHIYIN